MKIRPAAASCNRKSRKYRSNTQQQCCGSGSGTPCLFDPWIWDPGWVKNRIRIRDEHPRSYFRELGKIWIRVKHPGSATLPSSSRGGGGTLESLTRVVFWCKVTGLCAVFVSGSVPRYYFLPRRLFFYSEGSEESGF